MFRQSLADPCSAGSQGLYDALQDKLFPAPAASDLVALVAVDHKPARAGLEPKVLGLRAIRVDERVASAV